jgi:transposase
VREAPTEHGLARSRWRLADLAQTLDWLTGASRSGISRLLGRCGIRFKRGRVRLHSPDPAYAQKARDLHRALTLARTYPHRVTLLYGDELSFYRQPTLAARPYPVGEEPTVALSQRANTRHRIAGALDAVTGRVTVTSGSKIGRAKLMGFLRELRAAYPERWLFLVWDNWPVHAHPEVVAVARQLHIHLLWLPTYAPWLNPIEKLWRLVKQTVLHQHDRADDWDGLKAAVMTCLAAYEPGALDLLRYVGLLPK